MILSRPDRLGLCLLGLLLSHLAMNGDTLVAAERPDIGPQLSAGKLAEAEQALVKYLASRCRR